MRDGRPTPSLLAVGAILLVAAAGGYLIGSGAAIGQSDADKVRDDSFSQSRDRTEREVAKSTASRGFAVGLKRGRLTGREFGVREGMKFGAGVAALQIVEAETAASRDAAAAARAEISARQANCGAAVRAPEWCPTADELAAWRAAARAARQAENAAEQNDHADR